MGVSILPHLESSISSRMSTGPVFFLAIQFLFLLPSLFVSLWFEKNYLIDLLLYKTL